LLQRLHEFPAEWNLPPLPPEAEVRMLDPVGTGIDFRPPDLSDLPVMPLELPGNSPIQDAKAGALRAAIRATGEAVKNQAKFQAITIGHWLKRLEAFQERLNTLAEEIECEHAAAVLGRPTVRPVPAAPADAVDSPSPPPRDLSADLQTLGRLALASVLTKLGDEPLRTVRLTVQAASRRQLDLHFETEDGSVHYVFPSAELQTAMNDVLQNYDPDRDGWSGFEISVLPTGQMAINYSCDTRVRPG
jgi:hypothetical protein